MNRTQPIEILASHALASAPDSLTARRALLDAIVEALPAGNPLRRHAHFLRDQIDVHQARLAQIQGELPLIFTKR